MFNHRLGMLTAFLVLSSLAAPQSGQAQKREREGRPQPPLRPPVVFEFHNGFWVNLHHFLYLAAPASSGAHNPPGDAVDSSELTKLSASEREDWDAARAYYSTTLVHRDLLMDSGMEEIKNELEDSEGSPDLKDAKLAPELKSALLRAAPVYRKHWWPRHEKRNQEWVSELEPLVARYGAVLMQSLATIYDVPWPQQPIRVDAVAYANWAGAYTTLYPTRPTISTLNSGNQATAALEIVFHESSHAMMAQVRRAIDVAEQTRTAQHPASRFRHDLWHEVLFYTSGELVRELIPGYTPYADKNGLWVRAWRGADRELIEKDWKPHMSGQVTLAAALTKLVDDLSTQRQAQTPTA